MATIIYKGDDTNAFGENFIRILRPSNTDGYVITKAIFQCGPIQKIYRNPVFPIYVNFSSTESKKLSQTNECYLQVFDEKGLKKTCKGSLTFTAKAQVVRDDNRTKF